MVYTVVPKAGCATELSGGENGKNAGPQHHPQQVAISPDGSNHIYLRITGGDKRAPD